jgi:predicted RNA-binding protein YlqC (UPF0109 family)
MAAPSPPLPTDVLDLCAYLVRELVDEPEAVSVTEELGAGGERVFRVVVADADRGKVIGRSGRVVRALRTVIRAGGVRRQERIHIEIDE